MDVEAIRNPAPQPSTMRGFLGTYEHKLDAKGRLFVPRRVLESVADAEERAQFVLTLGLDGCLYLFTRRAFLEHFAQVRQAAFGQPEYRAVMRGLGACSSEQGLDAQGRILIPEDLRQQVGLGEDVVVVGAVDHVEIWDRAQWRQVAGPGAVRTYLDKAEHVLSARPDSGVES
ncbi:MAG: cell division/cell wall cluster transcriptional repressor MraZ [Planctomycetota bacterium]|nr:MAG: cell division/cell wall cluster transcriptional repressor MraZ [Planctomycetota bacterium]